MSLQLHWASKWGVSAKVSGWKQTFKIYLGEKWFTNTYTFLNLLTIILHYRGDVSISLADVQKQKYLALSSPRTAPRLNRCPGIISTSWTRRATTTSDASESGDIICRCWTLTSLCHKDQNWSCMMLLYHLLWSASVFHLRPGHLFASAL